MRISLRKRKRKIFLLPLLLVFFLLAGCAAPAVGTQAAPAPTATPASFEELLANALAYYEAGDYREAILCYQAAIEIEPKSFDAQYGLGRAYRADGQAANAVGTLLVAVGLEEGTHSASYELGYAYIEAGEYEEAEEIVLPLYESGDAEAGIVLALIYAAESKTDELLELLRDESVAESLNKMAPGDGAIYLGHRNEAGQKEGPGVGIYPGGYLYAGEYAADVRSGQGTWYYPGGYSYYAGRWANDAPNGSGTLTNELPDQKYIYEAQWINGVPDGQLIYTLYHATGDGNDHNPHVWIITVVNGYPVAIDPPHGGANPNPEGLYCIGVCSCGSEVWWDPERLMACIFPFAH
jgi:tetratricopeptide (TPR) repeat protein